MNVRPTKVRQSRLYEVANVAGHHIYSRLYEVGANISSVPHHPPPTEQYQPVLASTILITF